MPLAYPSTEPCTPNCGAKSCPPKGTMSETISYSTGSDLNTTVLFVFAWSADQHICHPTSRFGCPFTSVFEPRRFERIICCDWCYVVVSTSCVHHITEILNEFRQAALKFWNYDATIHSKQMSTGFSPCLMPTKQHHLAWTIAQSCWAMCRRWCPAQHRFKL